MNNEVAKPRAKFQNEEHRENSRSVWTAVASAPLFPGGEEVLMTAIASCSTKSGDESRAVQTLREIRKFLACRGGGRAVQCLCSES
jgi:hypothetical protein